ncbi:hypothetical protein [Coraliomargarita parva]|uniref:hypothetical protein n=1 Tax=Coraliomargarita parva TaxID=3014050 RepID=UPI0022B4E05A|nr:hypothetical protein [Coraliomargarita parva]
MDNEERIKRIEAILAAAKELGSFDDEDGWMQLGDDYGEATGLAQVVADHCGYSPAHVFHWVALVLSNCDIDIESHPVIGMLDIAAEYFKAQEAEEEEEQDPDA